MNKQEAIEKIKKLKMAFATKLARSEKKSLSLTSGATVVELQDVIDIINQIDEPEKPVIPQFVAEHIEYHKRLNSPMGDIFNRHFDDKRVEVWFREAPNAYDNLGKAWLFGYEVEKEPIYVIRSKGTTNKYGAQQRLCHSGEKGNYFWCGEFSKFKHKFTRKELEQAGFGWVFDCEGVEVREVK